MGSSTYNDASQKQLEDELIDAGSRLLMLSSFIDELLSLLEKAEKLLTMVRQQPPKSTGDALLPVMKALVTDDLLRHVDVNVQVAVASCINELTRITAPNPPYSDDEMKEVFQLFMVAFKQLPCESGPNYSRATQILETIAKVRSCLILLDIDCDALVVEMFQLFFSTIRCGRPSNILKHVEMIMTLLIEESDEISFELLGPLLTSVRKDNENISPVSFELGKTVFRKCRTKLQPRLKEAVKALNLDVDDYAEILTSLSEDSSNGNDMGRTYVVFVGHEPGLYDTWAEASEQVLGYRYAIHDSFDSREEAEKVYQAYMVRKSASSSRTGGPFRTTGNQSSLASSSSGTQSSFRTTGNQTSHAIPSSRTRGPFRTTENQSSHASSSSGTQASFRTTGNHSTSTGRTEVNMTKLEEIQQNLDEIKRIVAVVEGNLKELRMKKDN